MCTVRDYKTLEAFPGDVVMASQTVLFGCNYTGYIKWYFTKSTSLRNLRVMFIPSNQPRSVLHKLMESNSSGFYICVGNKNGIKHIARTFVDVIGKFRDNTYILFQHN